MCDKSETKSEYSTEFDEDSDEEYDISENFKRRKRSMDNTNDMEQFRSNPKKYKSYTRNALNARANRLKKKRYVENLEKEVLNLRSQNGKLKSILDNQSTLVQRLRKEVRYVKNVLANNSDIVKLLRAINGSTGIPVTTSINKHTTILNDFNLKNHLSPPSSNYNEMDILVKEESDLIFSNYDIPLCNDVLMGTSNDEGARSPLKEHSYTTPASRCRHDSGICLHVSSGKVSLEFCSTCQENAAIAWQDKDN